MLDQDLIAALLAEPDPDDRSNFEGCLQPQRLCADCGYGLNDTDTRCPKCNSASSEEATAFVAPARDLGKHFAKHVADDSRDSKATKAAKASGFPLGSKEYHEAYLTAYRAEHAKCTPKGKVPAKAKYVPPKIEPVVRAKYRAAAAKAKAERSKT